MGQGVALAAPAVERRDEVAQRRARLRLELFGRDDRPRRFGEGDAPGARVLVQALQGRVAEAAPGDVDDTFESEVVGRRIDQAQIGERIANLGPLVEARSADHPIGQAEGDEPVFELAHLKRGAYEDRDLVERMARPLQLLDLLADRAGLLLGIP